MAKFKLRWKFKCVDRYFSIAEAANPYNIESLQLMLCDSQQMLAEPSELSCPYVVPHCLLGVLGLVFQLLAEATATRYQSTAMLDTLTGKPN